MATPNYKFLGIMIYIYRGKAVNKDKTKVNQCKTNRITMNKRTCREHQGNTHI